MNVLSRARRRRARVMAGSSQEHKNPASPTPAPKTVRQGFFVAPRPRHPSNVASAVDNSGCSGCPGLADWLCRGWSVGDALYFHLRHRPHDWLWRYGAAAGARARTCDRDWCLWALSHGRHSGDCGPRHAHSACRFRHGRKVSARPNVSVGRGRR
jgi:hypothetical protein